MFESINQSLERRKIVTGTDCFKASDQHGKIVFKKLIIIALSSISKECSWIRQNSGVSVYNRVCVCVWALRPDDNAAGPFCAGSKS